jgi:hypothetical protein
VVVSLAVYRPNRHSLDCGLARPIKPVSTLTDQLQVRFRET